MNITSPYESNELIRKMISSISEEYSKETKKILENREYSADRFFKIIADQQKDYYKESDRQASISMGLKYLRDQKEKNLSAKLLSEAFSNIVSDNNYTETLWNEAGDIPDSLTKQKAYYKLWKTVSETRGHTNMENYEKGAKIYFAGLEFREKMEKERQKEKASSPEKKSGADYMQSYADYMSLFSPKWEKYASDLKSYERFNKAAKNTPEEYKAALYDYMRSEELSSRKLAEEIKKEQQKAEKEKEETIKQLSAPYKTYLQNMSKWSAERFQSDTDYKGEIIKNAKSEIGRVNSLFSMGQENLMTTVNWSSSSPSFLSPEALQMGKIKTDREIFAENYNNSLLPQSNYKELEAIIKEALNEKGNTEENLNYLKNLSKTVEQLAKALISDKNAIHAPEVII